MNIQFNALKTIKTKHVKLYLDSTLGIHSAAEAVQGHRLVAAWDDSDIDDDGEVLDYKFGFLQSIVYDGNSITFEILRVNSVTGISYVMNYKHAAPIIESRCPEVFCLCDDVANVGRVVGACRDSDGLHYKIRIRHGSENPFNVYCTDDEVVETSKIKLGLDLDKCNTQEAKNV